MPLLDTPAHDQYASARPAGPVERNGRSVRMLYVSRAVERLTQFEVMQIVVASRRHNWRAGVAGCLLFTGSEFAQVLEGPVATVQALPERLASDPRHTGVRILSSAAADDRRLSDWTMGCVVDADLSADVAALLEGSTASEGIARRLVARMAGDVPGRQLATVHR